MIRNLVRPAAALVLLMAAGCGANHFTSELPIDPQGLEDITDNGALSPQEKRDALAALGIEPEVINALLIDERLANQFGGTLTTAYNKVVDGRLAAMTADEVQLYGDATAVTTYDDEEALAIVSFFVKDDLQSTDDLSAYLDSPAADLPAAIDETNLRSVFLTTPTSTVRDQLP